MTKVLIVDCFDSFTYNIFHYLDSINKGNCIVVRYDDFQIAYAEEFSHVVLSPGPGIPSEYPKINSFLESYQSKKNILGVCLGMQCIHEAFVGSLRKLTEVKHGLQSSLQITNQSVLFNGLPSDLKIGHYHSWVVSEKDYPHSDYQITSRSQEGLIMSIEHKKKPIYGLQFHPESIMTDSGYKMLSNWLNIKSS